jgi:hypothetical protein
VFIPRNLVARTGLRKHQLVDLEMEGALPSALLAKHHPGQHETADRHGRRERRFAPAKPDPEHTCSQDSYLRGWVCAASATTVETCLTPLNTPLRASPP